MSTPPESLGSGSRQGQRASGEEANAVGVCQAHFDDDTPALNGVPDATANYSFCASRFTLSQPLARASRTRSNFSAPSPRIIDDRYHEHAHTAHDALGDPGLRARPREIPQIPQRPAIGGVRREPHIVRVPHPALPRRSKLTTIRSLLKRRQIRGSEPCAVATAHILLQVVARSKWQDVDGLLDNVSATGRRLVEAQPKELVVANIVRRVLALIRDEAAEDRNEPSSETQSETQMTPTDPVSHHWPPSTHTKQDSAGDCISNSPAAPPPSRPGPVPSYSSVNVPKSLFHLLSVSPPPDGSTMMTSPFRNSGTSTPTSKATPYSQVHALRSEVIDGIEEIKDEISQVDDQIAALAEVQIHPGDHVLVHQPSPTVERFILRAALKRKFTVLIATEAPRKQTEGVQNAAFRKRLSAAGITVINIKNSGLTAYMSRVDKVILGARSVVANGGVVTDSGAAAIARAAKEQGNAVIVLAGMYKLSPENPFDAESLIEWGDSSTFVSFADGPMVNGVEIRSAVTELVPPELIDTYVTNLGTHSRDHLSSLIADHYKQEDAEFHLWSATDR
ncbi:Putative translation initiation factor eIF-2B subunit beta [Tolypocladium paradoxum]|uniref:Translation initiation factor eIF2B subunit beta n=1 Tax=Tolypocladium paradoxum TaxID=94208 RepID=A0A2S4LA81_9HYPO|nr:Putative translation initiation factor eIF-2B subunit beta [Tolypocladium paradoxum]